MKRFYIFLLACFLINGAALAQVFGNEWIVFSQKYLKIKVAQDGLYRIDSTSLSNAVSSVGGSLSLIDARNFQLFHNGQEEYIWVEGENDGVVDGTDFIEFYGKKNYGEMDSSLYVGGAAKQLNPYFSLYNDTSVYFLTWNSSIANRRLTNPNDTAFSSYTPSPYFTDKEIFAGNVSYFTGVQDYYGITDPDFIPSEGYYDGIFSFGGSATRYLSTQHAYIGGPDATIQVKVGSHSDDWNAPQDNHIHFQFPGGTFDTIYNGFAVANYLFDSISPSLLNSSTTAVAVSSINSFSTANDGGTAIAFITLTYAHTFDLEGRIYFNGFLPDNLSASKSLVRMTNIGGSGPVRIYDFYNHQRIDAVDSANSKIWKALVANGNGSEKPFLMVSQSNVTMVNSFIPENGNGSFTDFSLQSADSVFAIVTCPSLMNVGIQYKNYRQSTSGGSRNVVLANVNELYDQFAWGIGQDPLSIRHFADFMIQTYPTRPGNLLLIGKSLYSDLARRWHYSENLVPTYGYPPCDNSLTAGLNGSYWVPAIATGRIAARDSAEAQWYLNKVIGYENQQPAEWMKHVLHFGGGTSSAEQQVYSAYLNGMKQTIEDTSFGGVVQSYFKTSSAPIQINQSDSLRQRIEDGVSIMTFFGHASGTGFDQSIDEPANYNNVNRYPLLIANSCYAGDIHSTGISSSEAFTLIDQKGTIGYIASVGVGVPGFLDIYSSGLYTAISQTRYQKSIGECMQYAIGRADTLQQTDTLILKATLFEMTLQGDPSVVINSFSKPDYVITNSDVWFDQLTNPDSIYVHAKITNIGRAVNDSIVVRLLRTFPNNTYETLDMFVRAPNYMDSLVFALPVDFQRGIGLNKIKITVDYFGSVFELNENNNSTGAIDLLIHGSSIIPVYPYEFAVIATDTVTLKACTVNPMEPTKIYRFEIDTTDLFNSPSKISTTIISAGGVVTWKPPINFPDSAVYFWRVSPDSILPSDAFYWRQSSFQYINGKIGWGQDHIFQFTNDNYQYARLNRTLRQFEFVNDIKVLSVKNGIYFTAVPWNESWYKLNGTEEAIFSCASGFGGNGFAVADIDNITNTPRSYFDTLVGQEPGGYLDCVGANQVLHAFDFYDSDTTNQNFAANFINAIPSGHRVLIYSQDYPFYTRIPYNAALQSAFQTFGCDTIGTSLVPDTCAFISWGIKNGPAGNATEVVGAQKNSVLYLQDTLITNWNSGYVESPVIGPAVSWGSFHWKEHPTETNSSDSTAVEIWGITAGGVKTQRGVFPKDSTDVLDLANYVNAANEPFIQLVCRMRDDSTHTPPQIDRWHVLYTPYPDAAVNPPLAFSYFADTLQEGQQAKLIVAIQNITPWPFTDSLLLTYWLVDNNQNKILLPQKIKAPSFNGYSWFADTLVVNTAGHPGANEIWLEVNPIGDQNSQLEQYHFNNVLMMPLHVGTDRTNPLLDVTFDGIHIMDKDIVSGKPNILISLKDENQFLALNDTADFNIFLRTPSQNVAQRIYFGSSCLQLCFTPAVLPHNSCKILFTPDCAQDGVYELIVQAKDRSNNQSGLIDYRISFEVVNTPSITDVLNYPNPFSTSTQFVFTLTGTEVPQLFTIQIITVTGKVVREINRDELGDLHIGRNITSYSWDGKDMYGDQLANGVYLYRVITRLDGNTMDHRESGADSYITHGFGKMYLMR